MGNQVWWRHTVWHRGNGVTPYDTMVILHDIMPLFFNGIWLQKAFNLWQSESNQNTQKHVFQSGDLWPMTLTIELIQDIIKGNPHTKLWVGRSHGSAVRALADGQTAWQTNGTDFIPSTADEGGKNKPYLRDVLMNLSKFLFTLCDVLSDYCSLCHGMSEENYLINHCLSVFPPALLSVMLKHYCYHFLIKAGDTRAKHSPVPYHFNHGPYVSYLSFTVGE